MTAAALKFLVVDDDALLRMATRNMLRAMNAHAVLEAHNGTAALEALSQPAEKAIDIVLCDLNMPGMDGMEFLRHLGEGHASVSVIVVSSHDDALISAVQKMAAAYGVKLLGAVQKPIEREHLEGFILRYKPPAPKSDKKPSSLPKFSLDEILQGIQQKEFEPFYQPKVDFKTKQITGAEALARWNHPQHGLVPPYAFIETLEANGEEGIKALTMVILEKSALAARQLHDKGHKFPLSVNLSLNLLGDPQLAERIMQTVKNAGSAPKHIILEITESAAMADVAHSLENLARLKMHGFSLSIDDYGTGFSNIQQISRIAFDELKIDQTFVKDCTDKKDLCAIVESSIDLAHKLKIKCVAEGVETEQDWKTLKSMDCDVAQGYFIAKPMNLAAFFDFCSKKSW